jgi:lysozyme
MITCLRDQLIRDEGVRLLPYRDTRGILTIGVGHNLQAKPLPFDVWKGITFSQATQILDDDISDVTAGLYHNLPWLRTIDPVRQGVFGNMGFNLGVGGILEFHHDLADTQAGNYLQAAADMKASEWYTQVGDRAVRLVQQMATGIWR